MKCEVRVCNKEIQEGNLVMLPAVKQTLLGNVKVPFFVVVCQECIDNKRVTENIRGSVKIIS